VSQATLYNYFPNKSALAEGWVRGEIDRALSAMSTELEAQGLRRAMRAFCRELAVVACGHEDAAVRLEAWREAGRARLQPIGSGHPLVIALSRWQESERVRRDIDAATIATILLESVEGGLIDGLRQGLDTPPAITKALRTRVDLILDGARKRNERVSVLAASRAPAAN
jgi:AcrR family transcriptional regulator